MDSWREQEERVYSNFNIMLTEALGDNKDALALCNQLLYIVHLVDDLVDGDKKRHPREIELAFTMAMGIIPTNPFYQEHIKELGPIVLNMYLKWHVANMLEKGDDDNRMISFIMRVGYIDVFLQCMYLVGGYDRIVKAGPKFCGVIGTGAVNLYEEFKQEMIDKYDHKKEEG